MCKKLYDLIVLESEHLSINYFFYRGDSHFFTVQCSEKNIVCAFNVVYQFCYIPLL